MNLQSRRERAPLTRARHRETTHRPFRFIFSAPPPESPSSAPFSPPTPLHSPPSAHSAHIRRLSSTRRRTPLRVDPKTKPSVQSSVAQKEANVPSRKLVRKPTKRPPTNIRRMADFVFSLLQTAFVDADVEDEDSKNAMTKFLRLVKKSLKEKVRNTHLPSISVSLLFPLSLSLSLYPSIHLSISMSLCLYVWTTHLNCELFSHHCIWFCVIMWTGCRNSRM
jgi:hypothetical protein